MSSSTTLSDGSIRVVLDGGGFVRHVEKHEAGGSDELDLGGLSASDDISLNSGETVVDYSAKEVPQSFLGGDANSLSLPLPDSDLAEDYYTQTTADSTFVDEAGDQMSGTLTANGSPAVDAGGDVEVTGSVDVTKAFELRPTSNPNPPASGWKLFCDDDDGDKLKAIDSSGNITTITS
jgi:hypothetical protein